MSILNWKGTVHKPVPAGNYDLPLVKREDVVNEKGGFVRLTFKNDEFEIPYIIFANAKPTTRAYLIETLGAQVEKYGEQDIDDLIIIGHVYHLYVSYNENGRNISFGVRNNTETEETPAESTEVPF